MQSKILSKRTLLIVILIGFVFFLALLFYFIIKSSTQKGLKLPTENVVVLPEKTIFGLPVRLKIPGINVDSAIKYVGLTPDGAMDVPKGPDDVAWFNLGPRPGEIGNAVISGHFGWKNNIPTVFDNLYKLNKGDKIYVEDEKGVIITFIVRESRRYDLNADASDVFILNDEKSHLNLITCEGVWDKVSKTYSKRLVVFTDKE